MAEEKETKEEKNRFNFKKILRRAGVLASIILIIFLFLIFTRTLEFKRIIKGKPKTKQRKTEIKVYFRKEKIGMFLENSLNKIKEYARKKRKEKERSKIYQLEAQLKKEREKFAREREILEKEKFLIEKEKRNLQEEKRKVQEQLLSLNVIVEKTPYNKEEVSRLAKIYEEMPEEEAAKILGNLEDELILEIFKEMKDKKISRILANMEPSKSARLSKLMVLKK